MNKNITIIVMAVLVIGSVTTFSQAAWIHAKAMLAQELLQAAWQRSLVSGAAVRPWAWSDTWPVAKLSLPGSDIEMIVLRGGNGGSLPFAPGTMSGSVLPGEQGISLVVAHRDTHFRFLRDIRVGQRLEVTRRDKAVVPYRVSSVNVVDIGNRGMQIRSLHSQLVLVTCYPFDAIETGTPYRYVVTADAVTTPYLTRM